MNYTEFEEAVCNEVLQTLNCTGNEARDLIEANPFYMAQGWGSEAHPKAIALKIASQLK